MLRKVSIAKDMISAKFPLAKVIRSKTGAAYPCESFFRQLPTPPRDKISNFEILVNSQVNVLSIYQLFTVNQWGLKWFW